VDAKEAVMARNKKLEAVGEEIIAKEASWTFDGNTPRTFTAHVRRSVPFYDVGHDLVCRLSDYFIQDNSVCYDLGTSTGVLLDKLAKRHKHRSGVQWIGIDVVPNMINRAKEEMKSKKNIKLVIDDVALHEYQKSDMIIAYYTMQFVRPYIRQDVFNKIYEALNWGGAFIMFEKVRACDARFQDIMQTLYSDFKLEQGFTAEEIIAKTKSLKGVLDPFSSQGNIDLLKRAGFVDMITIFKYICFEGFLAIK
jgi:tRNA (cmo5U34)-methyltransferase